jgi:hypothetical protein
MTGRSKFSSQNMCKLYGQSTDSFLEKKPTPTPTPTLNLIKAVGHIVTKGECICGDRILKSVKIAEITNTIIKSELPLSVVNENDRITGKISKSKLISVLCRSKD